MKRFLPWLFPLLAALVALSFWPGLDLNEDVSDLLPDGPGRGELVFLKESGMLDRLVVTVSADDPEILSRGLDLCGRALEDSGLFRRVFSRVDDTAALLAPAVAANLPWLMTEDDYAWLAGFLAPDKLHDKLARLFVFLNSPPGFGAGEIAVADPLGLTARVLSRTKGLAGSLRFNVVDGHIISHDRRHGLIMAESRGSLTDSGRAAEIASRLAMIRTRVLPAGVTMTVTGPLPHTLANRETIRRDLVVLLPLASVVLILFLVAAFRSPAGLALFLVPLLAAPPAVVFAAMIHGRLSGMALGFGIVLLGIGVDFAVHLYFARKSGFGVKAVGRPLAAAAASTLGCFAVSFKHLLPP